MAYFNLDAVNESVEVEEVEETSILDNMLEACEYMLDTLDEANAYSRHLDNLAKKDEELKKSQDKILAYQKMSGTKTGEDKLKDIYSKRRALYNSGSDGYARHRPGFSYDLANSGESIKNRVEKDRNDAKEDNEYSRDWEHEYKKNWMHSHGNKGEDRFANKKPGSVKAINDKNKEEKKKAIKETCLHILSIIDDIE